MSVTCNRCGGRKNRQSRMCRKCYKVYTNLPVVRARRSAAMKGKPSYERTDEHRKKLSEVMKGKPKPTGWKHSSETRAKIAAAWTPEKRQAARDRGNVIKTDAKWRKSVSSFGEKNPMWRGGESSSKYAPGFDSVLKMTIKERDNFTCQLCGITEKETGCCHSIHHIDYSKNNHCPDNLATTCKACNSRVNTNESVWYGYFIALADARRNLGKNVLKFIGRKIISQHAGYVFVSRNDSPSFVGTEFESFVTGTNPSPVT